MTEFNNEELNQTEKAPKKKKSYKPFWLIYIISILVMGATIYYSYQLHTLLASYTFLPVKYVDYLKYGLIGFNVFFGLLAILPFIDNINKVLQILISGALCFGLFTAYDVIPTYKGQMERVFTEVPTEGELLINVYVDSDSEYQTIYDLEGKRIGIQSKIDEEYQQYALKVINKEYSGQEATTVVYDDIYSVVEALYANEVDAILLNESYVDIVADNADFLTFKDDTRNIYTCVQPITLEYDSSAVGNIAEEPFIVLVGGNDSWNLSSVNLATNAGRTDVNMMVVVNPNTKQLLIVSIPRDSYVYLWGDYGCPDKLTHSTVYSLDCWRRTINAMFDLEVNYFVRVNFSSIVNVVDALGGVDIDNPYYFESGAVVYYNANNGDYKQVRVKFPEGALHLNGAEALGYCRERYYVRPDTGMSISDYGRNEHQAIVIKALIDQATSVSTITHISDLFEAIAGTFNTDLSMDQIYALVQMQLNDMATWDMITTSITGSGAMRPCYAMGLNSGNDFSVVIVNQNSVEKARDMINKMLNNEVLEK